MKSLREFVRPGSQQARRAERVPLEMPLIFRHPEHTAWCKGIAANFSSTGILFRADQVMKVHAPIQMSYILPATIAGGTEVAVRSVGEIVRTETPADRDGTFLFAVRILGYYAGTP